MLFRSPELYDRLFVPLIFQPYADDLARRVAALVPSRVLETAAGTGVVTRAMVQALPAHVELIATDLNPPMLDRAAAVGTSRPVQWQQADAMQLPFDDECFDVVVCQFGAMFFPDKTKVHAEALRVLKPGAPFLFNVWNNLADNEIADVVREAVYERYLDNPADFFARVPLCRRGSALGRLRDGFRLWSSPQGSETGRPETGRPETGWT